MDLVIIHYGFMTEDLRKQHRDRWYSIYKASVGDVPSGIWDYVLSKEYTPEVIPNPYTVR